MNNKTMFLALEFEDGETIYEILENMSMKEARKIAKDALEDAPIVRLLQSYDDEKYGKQPATHLDYIEEFKA